MSRWCYQIDAPLRVPKNKKGGCFSLNLNVYRNSHPMVLNNAKKTFKGMMIPLMVDLPKFHKVEIRYKLFPKTKRLCDVSNVCSIVDKFFCDALVELGKIEDDNYLFIPKVTYEIGEVDKHNPRVEIRITDAN